MPLPRTLPTAEQEQAFMVWLAAYELEHRVELRVAEEHAARLAFLAGVKHAKACRLKPET